MRASAKLFAERGFSAVSTIELGEAVGISGPGLYNYFSSKEALLSELLIDVSTRLLSGALEITSDPRPKRELLDALIDFHVTFSTTEPDIIVLQDRELANLPAESNHQVRKLQREYLAEWKRVLAGIRPEFSSAELDTRLLATFGLINSTPHSASSNRSRTAATLNTMARAALLATT